MKQVVKEFQGNYGEPNFREQFGDEQNQYIHRQSFAIMVQQNQEEEQKQ